MREVNFSIPNANKASVGITTALYDRRALDCTSTLPLINSLNNLAYLTTSSGRIRDILTVDGGIERLVSILKRGRSKDMMEMWKWNLAFQCIVNIGVRGSESVRTRVVEADMVPVIATILDNYFQVIEKCRERKYSLGGAKSTVRPLARPDANDVRGNGGVRSRRNVPAPIAIPDPREPHDQDDSTGEITPTISTANMSLSSPQDRGYFGRPHINHRHSASRGGGGGGGGVQPLSPGSAEAHSFSEPAAPAQTGPHSMFGLRPVRDIDRLPSMVPTLHAELASQPQSPTTPHTVVTLQNGARTVASGSRPNRRRPSVNHQPSMSGSEDDGQIDETRSEDSNANGQREPVVGIQQSDIVMQDIVDDGGLLEEQQPGAVTLAVPEVSSADDETFNITHRSAADGSLVNPTAPPAQGQMGFPQNPMPPPVNPLNATPPNMHQTPAWLPSSRGLPLDRSTPANILAAMPRDEDVLMSLQLLAYVSKYCYLRSYFQQTRLVSRLKIGSDLQMLDPDSDPADCVGPTQEELDDEWDNEYVEKPGEKPYNIFPLIEKFTAKASSSSSRHALNPTSPQQGDMQYWAGVVMRNLCRKDESRGGIRQCAYWKCGKWEEWTRQFAKCRRCRRTKYCSKECQKGAWGSHRFWCVAAEPGDGEAGSSDRQHHRGHHHRSSQHQQQQQQQQQQHHHHHHQGHT